MTRPIQPGNKEGSIAGGLAVDCNRGRFPWSFGTLGRRAVSPGKSFARNDMTSYVLGRLCLGALLSLLVAAGPVCAQSQQQQRRLVPDAKPVRPDTRTASPTAQNAPPAREEHLQRWMQNHSSMSLAQQQRALQNEPGFRELPSGVQQERLRTLERLYNMNPQQRTRILDRAEALERLGPVQRQQWRDAVQNLNMLPPPRKHMLAGAILELRELAPEQRESALASPAYASHFSPKERQTLRTLLMAEPYPAVRTPRPAYPPPPVP